MVLAFQLYFIESLLSIRHGQAMAKEPRLIRPAEITEILLIVSSHKIAVLCLIVQCFRSHVNKELITS